MWDEEGKLLSRIRDDEDLELDGVIYGRTDIKKIPAGFASVPLKVDDNGTEYNTKMTADSFGIQAISSGQRTDPGDKHADMRYGGEDQQHEPASGTGEPGLTRCSRSPVGSCMRSGGDEWKLRGLLPRFIPIFRC